MLDLVAVFSVIPAGFWCRLSEKEKQTNKKNTVGEENISQPPKRQKQFHTGNRNCQFLRRRGLAGGGGIVSERKREGWEMEEARQTITNSN